MAWGGLEDMKTVSVILLLLIVGFFILFFVLGLISRSGDAAGLVEGRLSKCPNKPNCVSSEQKSDTGHYVEPIAISMDNASEVLPILRTSIHEMGGSIESESDNYLAATFTSSFFRFVDDLEVRIDPAESLIHIRSASRVGHSDAGVNRKRVELLRKLYSDKASKAGA